ncbi:hypothetical protein JDV09_25430 [Mycobacterium sp. Y57]|uniref:hypothetical protein n=1 Tax=Mycolicibacterium xanthum TaxID=2796469 RepID=UPI001C860878|nr:hypothetical protein [Mycolicibacterium xanthum]MBX7435415.1 hypothetical protein [Mycolicibacterium xanthum]
MAQFVALPFLGMLAVGVLVGAGYRLWFGYQGRHRQRRRDKARHPSSQSKVLGLVLVLVSLVVPEDDPAFDCRRDGAVSNYCCRQINDSGR